jgi:predicted nucleic acid-binding protein
MSFFIADTNIISELVRKRPNPAVLDWIEYQERLALSAVTVEEVEYGLSSNPNQASRRVLERVIGACLIYPVTFEVGRLAGELRGGLRRRGVTRSQSDMLIAATALVHGCVVATRNVKDFEGCGVEVFNPWEF